MKNSKTSISLKHSLWIVLLAASLSNTHTATAQSKYSNSPAKLEDLPAWLYSYPGSKPTLNTSTKSDKRLSMSFAFQTKDTVNNVAGYYQQKLMSAGMNPEKSINTSSGGKKETKIQTSILNNNHTSISITIAPDDNDYSTVSVYYSNYDKNIASNGGKSRGTMILGLIIIAFLIIFSTNGFWIWMMMDCIKNEPDDNSWIRVIRHFHFLGALLYFIIRRRKRKAEVGV